MSADEAGAAAPPLLETKLHAPRRRRGVVERPRLTDRLGRGDAPVAHDRGRAGGVREDDAAGRLVHQHRTRATARRRGCPSMPATTTRPCSGPTSSPPCRRWCPTPADARCRCCGRPNRWSRSWRRCSTTSPASTTRSCWCSTTTTSSSRRSCTRPWPSCSSTCHRRSTWCSAAGPIRRCRWRASALGASCSRSVPPTCGSPPTRPPPTSTTRWACT